MPPSAGRRAKPKPATRKAPKRRTARPAKARGSVARRPAAKRAAKGRGKAASPRRSTRRAPRQAAKRTGRANGTAKANGKAAAKPSATSNGGTAVKHDYDVAIIGGGPAGSTLAGYLAKGGAKVVVLEKEKFPRHHVGESLVPATTRAFRELGFVDTMEKSGFVRKFGAVWTTATSKPTYATDFQTKDWKDSQIKSYSHDLTGFNVESQAAIQFKERDQEGVPLPYTWHVDRAKFDDLLLKHAGKLGATVWQETTVLDVDFNDPGFVAVKYQDKKGKPGTLRVKMVADASGRRTLVGTKTGLKVVDPVFDQYAVHAWFKGLDRGPKDKEQYIYIHFLPLTNSWVWQIPITEDVTSVGVVTQKHNLGKSAGDREALFWESIASRPDLEKRLKAAKQMWPFKTEGDYSYAMKRFCGDRFVLIGDAARFVDPIFSSGVSIALQSARLSSRDILKAIEANDFREERFKQFETVMKWGTRNWYAFINLYYRLNVLFTYFILDPATRGDIIALLQGELYEEKEPKVLGEMRRIVKEVEGNPKHPWHAALGELSAKALHEAA